jgi:hypothetical protein
MVLAAEESGFDSRQEERVFLLHSVLTAYETQSLLYKEYRRLNGWGGRGVEGNYSPPSGGVKNASNCTPTPSHIFMAWCLIK